VDRWTRRLHDRRRLALDAEEDDMVNDEFDVIVIGGGPAGSTTAALLTQQQRRVLVLERDKFPRYHIGESLVTGILPIVEQLGLTDEMSRLGFMRKAGVNVAWGRDLEPTLFHFNEHGPYEYTYEVTRADFDTMLIRQARRLGAMVIEDASVLDTLIEDGRCCGVTYRLSRSDEVREARGRMIVDATGQSHLLGRKLGLLEWDEELKNLAVWSYYQGARTLPGIDAGNLLLETMPDGWLWTIPLADGTHSVGWVTSTRNAAAHDARPGELLELRIRESTQTRELLEPSTRVSGFRTIRDWSYVCSRFSGPGFLLVGDAACFVDPLWSTGVFLAMRGGRLAAQILEPLLDGSGDEEELLVAYETVYKDFVSTILSLVKFFYDSTMDMDRYCARAQELIDPTKELSPREDFIRLISGLSAATDVMSAVAPHGGAVVPAGSTPLVSR
jgi:FAD-dependent halogenase